jgi:hypothetical protein
MSKLWWPDHPTRVVIVLLLLGAVLVGGGLKVLLDGRRFLATAVEARGVVVGVAKVRDQDGEGLEVIRSVPVVEFVTAGERVVRYQVPVGSYPRTSSSAGRSGSSTTPPTPSTSSWTPGTSCGTWASSSLGWGWRWRSPVWRCSCWCG